MMMQKIRLQRKFTLKNKVDPIERLSQISKMMILFQLALIVVFCILSFSFQFHLSHLFTCQFWTNEKIINSNLALAICTLLLLPYIVFFEKTTVALVKDLIATALTLHTTISMLINQHLSATFIIFVVVLGAIVSLLGSYGAIFREQKKLIDQIRSIETADRSQNRLRQEQLEHLHLNNSP